MNKEIYFWIALLAVAIIAGLYIRLYYSPQLQPVVSLNTSGINTTLYPFQKLSVPITVQNAGSAPIKNMSVEIELNGNATEFYRVTIPQGKLTTIYFNYTFDSPGTYVLSAIADPGRIMNIADRNAAAKSISITVLRQEAGEAFATLPTSGLKSIKVINLEPTGYIVLSYLNANYNISAFNFASGNPLFRVMMPLLNTTIKYISNVSIAEAHYSNGTNISSMWVRGYLSPTAISAAAEGIGINAISINYSSVNATLVHFKNSTVCSWYSGGWIKVVGYPGNGSCTEFIANNNTYVENLLNSSTYAPYKKLGEGETYIGNYSMTGSSGELFYKLFIYNGAAVIASVGGYNSTAQQTCFGIINTVKNDSYCSTYLLQKNGTLSNISLVRTTLLSPPYNVSIFYIINESKALSFVPTSIGMINALNISHSISFASGFTNSCSFNSSFACSRPNFASGMLSFRVTSLLKNATAINSAYCFQYTKGKMSVVNASLEYNESRNVTVACYNGNNMLFGEPLSLHLNLLLNYTVNGTYHLANGTAVIYGFSG